MVTLQTLKRYFFHSVGFSLLSFSFSKQALKSRVTCEIRALAVLPVQDLAKQVYEVFLTYCQDTRLKV